MGSKKIRSPAKGSLKAFEASWRQILESGDKEARGKALAQLSYENAQLRRRLETVEGYLLTQALGLANIQGDNHLLECDKRQNGACECSCGSVPSDQKRR